MASVVALQRRQHSRSVHQRFDVVRFDGDGAVETRPVRHSGVKLLQQTGTIVVGIMSCRPRLNRRAYQPLGICNLARLIANDAQSVQRVEVGRFRSQHLLINSRGIRELSGAPKIQCVLQRGFRTRRPRLSRCLLPQRS